MGALVTVMVSPHLADGCEVTDEAAAALLAGGWTPPTGFEQSNPRCLYDSQMTDDAATAASSQRTPRTATIRERSADYGGKPYWEGITKSPRIPDADKLQALHWCKSALAATIRRSVQDDAFESWTGAVEGAWWALALDDALEQHFHRIYKEARDASPDGRVIKGMRWLRNRHAHDILLTASGGAKKPFFDPPGGGLFYISSSNRWMKSEEIIGERNDLSASLRPTYDEHVAGLPLNMSLEIALAWFDAVFEATGFPEPSVPVDPTVLGRG